MSINNRFYEESPFNSSQRNAYLNGFSLRLLELATYASAVNDINQEIYTSTQPSSSTNLYELPISDSGIGTGSIPTSNGSVAGRNGWAM